MVPCAATVPNPAKNDPSAGALALRSLHFLFAVGEASLVFLVSLFRARAGERVAHASGKATVAVCTRLGATFIKLGQIASTRADLLPAALIEELATLQDQVPAFPFEQVRETIERELHCSLGEAFAEFDPEPVAAASVAQVHRARLGPRGRLVAVKVRRPEIVERVELDRRILLFTARVLERLVPTLRLISLEDAVRSFGHAVDAQLDLRIEAGNNRRFARNFADDPEIDFPRLHPAWCSESVLTMDFIETIHERDLERRGIDVRGIVAAGMRAVCRMIFLHGFVHADLHPGNVRFVAPGHVMLLDLGLVGEIGDVDRRTTAELLFAFATGDGETVARLFFENAPHRATRDYRAYERDICEFVSSVKDRGLAKLQVTLEIGRIFDILRRHRVQAKAHMTMVNLALMTAEGMGKRLAPDLSLTEAALPYLREALAVPVPTPGDSALASGADVPR